MAKDAKAKAGYKVVADNRKARFHYEILDTYEAGIALTGTEVKSLRQGKATIGEAYAGPSGEELFLFNAYIPEYLQANRFNHETRRPRRLLLHKRQIGKLIGATQREGFTVIPLKIYFNERGRAKVELGLGRGKKLHDKRETEKQRSWDRERGRLLREMGRCNAAWLSPTAIGFRARPCRRSQELGGCRSAARDRPWEAGARRGRTGPRTRPRRAQGARPAPLDPGQFSSRDARGRGTRPPAAAIRRRSSQ